MGYLGYLTLSYKKSQKMARSMKFWIEEDDRLYYQCSENKDAYQISCTVTLQLNCIFVFLYAKKLVFFPCITTIRASASENQQYAYAKTKAQISCAVTAQLISAFAFATQIVQVLFFLNPKFQASNHLLRLYRRACVKPGGNP